MSKSTSKINIPEARAAMDKFKMEAANEVGVDLKQGYNGHLTSREAGSVGGQMVKKMIEDYENKIKEGFVSQSLATSEQKAKRPRRPLCFSPFCAEKSYGHTPHNRSAAHRLSAGIQIPDCTYEPDRRPAHPFLPCAETGRTPEAVYQRTSGFHNR